MRQDLPPSAVRFRTMPAYHWPIFYVLLFVGLVTALIIAVRIPPILDFPNHFTRIWLIGGGINDAFLSKVYEIDWHQAATNIGIDLLAWFAGPTLGAEILSRGLLLLAIVLPPIGGIVLHRMIHGGSYVWQIGILFLAWNTPLIGGFVNFEIGLGLALLFSSVDLLFRKRHFALLFLWRALATFILTIDHIFAAGFYMVLMGAIELPANFAEFRDRGMLWVSVRRIVVGTVACGLPLAAVILTAPNLPGGANALATTIWNPPLLVVANLISAVASYYTLIDVLFLIPIVMMLFDANRKGALTFHAGLVVACGFLLLLSLLSPRHAFATGWICWRFPIMMVLTGAVALCPHPSAERRQQSIVVGILAASVFIRSGWVSYIWLMQQDDVAQVNEVLSSIPRGSKILPISNVRLPLESHFFKWNRYFFWGQDTFRHLPTLSTLDHGSFVPTIFTAVGKQPLKVRPEFASSTVPEGGIYTPGSLLCPDMYQYFLSIAPYYDDWRHKFDYLLLLNADVPDHYVDFALPAGLTPVATTAFAKVFVIDRSLPSTAPEPASEACPPPADIYFN